MVLHPFLDNGWKILVENQEQFIDKFDLDVQFVQKAEKSI